MLRPVRSLIDGGGPGVEQHRGGIAMNKSSGQCAAVSRGSVDLLESRRLLAAQLFADVDPRTADTTFGTFADAGSAVYFVANGDLWRNDGTASGTSLFKSSLSGPPRELTRVGGLLFFVDKSATLTDALWRTDGTAAGTFQLTIIGDATTHGLTNVGGTLYFSASSSAAGTELWKSNGTSPAPAS